MFQKDTYLSSNVDVLKQDINRIAQYAMYAYCIFALFSLAFSVCRQAGLSFRTSPILIPISPILVTIKQLVLQLAPIALWGIFRCTLPADSLHQREHHQYDNNDIGLYIRLLHDVSGDKNDRMYRAIKPNKYKFSDIQITESVISFTERKLQYTANFTQKHKKFAIHCKFPEKVSYICSAFHF